MTNKTQTTLSTDLLNRVLVGGNHLGIIIGTDHPPHTATNNEALSHYGASDKYEAWCCWKIIMELANVIRK